ncbi:MAG: imidazolonepropionase [Bacteroidales bacterium]|nr:imidazolonepropionase [Bacteroidales bacterium]
MKLLIKNIKKLVQIEEEGNQLKTKVSGKDMNKLNCIDNAYLLINNDFIEDFGSMSEIEVINKKNKDCEYLTEIDAEGRMVFPSFCDSHTHLVYAGSREIEYIDKIKGLSYEEIAKRGGGILNSSKLLHNTSEEELIAQAFERLEEIKMFGTGAVEIKSGYGLSVEDEIKMLRVIKKLKEISPLTIKSTFLGAHAVPAEYKSNQKAYVDLIINKMLPKVAEENLADFVDVFCDRGFFTVEETDRILSAAAKYGLRPKIHANELDYSGGIQIGVKHNALSVDHLEYTGDEEIKALLKSNTMPTILPGAAFFLGMVYAPVRKMMNAGLPIALASDFNPGSSPSGNMQFVCSLACIAYKMTPEEVFNATTINTAYAMDVNKELGTIARGKKANVFITKPIPSYEFMPYAFGSNKIEKVIINGKIQ